MRPLNLRPIILCAILWATTLTAAEPVRLTHDGTLKRDPRFVEEGQEIVYCYDEAPDLIRMMRIRLDESTPVPMFDNSGDKHQLEPFFSPDGRYIVFTECTGNLSARLVIREQQSNKGVRDVLWQVTAMTLPQLPKGSSNTFEIRRYERSTKSTCRQDTAKPLEPKWPRSKRSMHD